MEILDEFNSITDLSTLQNLSDSTIAQINGSRVLQLLLNKIIKVVVGGKSSEINNLLSDNINFIFNEISIMDENNNIITSRIPDIVYINDYIGGEVISNNEITGDILSRRYRNYADYIMSSTGTLLANNIKNKYVEYYDLAGNLGEESGGAIFDTHALKSRRARVELYSDWQNSYYRECYETTRQLYVDYKFNRASKRGYYSQYYESGVLYFSIKCDLEDGIGLFTIYDEASRKKIIEIETAPYVNKFNIRKLNID
jgi:hypothetical protein